MLFHNYNNYLDFNLPVKMQLYADNRYNNELTSSSSSDDDGIIFIFQK